MAPDKTRLMSPQAATGYQEVRALLGDRYDVLRVIGRGAFGIVYQARDNRLGRTVAVKCLRPAAQQSMHELLSEARIAAQLDHPNVATVFDVVERNIGCAVVMAYLPGGCLAEKIQAGPVPVGTVISWSQQMLGALAAAHRAGVVHRDVKPANVLFDAGGQVKLSDFGIAVRGMATDALPAGTPNYMAPEQMLTGQTVDLRADLYAAGIVLSELVTGTRPYDLSNANTLDEAFDFLERIPWTPTRPPADHVPVPLTQLINRLTQRRPQDRPDSAATVLRALSQIRPQSNQVKESLTLPPLQCEEMFADVLRIALLDNIISPGERRDLIQRAKRLSIPPDRSRLIEEQVRRELGIASLAHVARFEGRALQLLSDGDMSCSDAKSLTELATELGISDDERQRIQDRMLVRYKLREADATVQDTTGF